MTIGTLIYKIIALKIPHLLFLPHTKEGRWKGCGDHLYLDLYVLFHSISDIILTLCLPFLDLLACMLGRYVSPTVTSRTRGSAENPNVPWECGVDAREGKTEFLGGSLNRYHHHGRFFLSKSWGKDGTLSAHCPSSNFGLHNVHRTTFALPGIPSYPCHRAPTLTTSPI